MGAAITAMHYTAMAAATFTPSASVPDLSHAVSISFLGTVGITVVTVMVLWVALLTALVDRLREQRALLDELFEQAPQAVALLSVDHRVVRVHRGFTHVFGYTPPETLGRRISELIVPDEARQAPAEASHREMILLPSTVCSHGCTCLSGNLRDRIFQLSNRFHWRRGDGFPPHCSSRT